MSLREFAPVDPARPPFRMNQDIVFLEGAAGNVTNGLVPFAQDLGFLANDLDPLPQAATVLPHEPWVSSADLVSPVTNSLRFAAGLFVLAKARRQHAKTLFAVAEDVGWLPAGLLSSTECGCRVSEGFGSPATDLCMLAEDLYQVSRDLVPRTTGLDRAAQNLVSLRTDLREEPKDLDHEPKGVSSLPRTFRWYSRVLL